jgi:CBS domain-containing protein
MSEHVRDVMMPAIWTVPATTPLSDAARLMRAWDVREVFVVDDGRLCGVLSDVDIVVLAIASGISPSELTVADCHDADAPRLPVDQLLPEAFAYMRRHRAQRLPVVDGDQLVGAVWMADLAETWLRCTAAGSP